MTPAILALLLSCGHSERPEPRPQLIDKPAPILSMGQIRWEVAEDLQSWTGSARWAPVDSSQYATAVQIHPAGDWALVQRREQAELWHLESGRYLVLPAGGGWFLDRTLRLESNLGMLDVPLDVGFDPADAVWTLASAPTSTWWIDDMVVVTGGSQSLVIDADDGSVRGRVDHPETTDRCRADHTSWTGLQGSQAASPWLCAAGAQGPNIDPTGSFNLHPHDGWLSDHRGEDELQSPLRHLHEPLAGGSWSLDGRRLVGRSNRLFAVWSVPKGRRLIARTTFGNFIDVALDATGRTVAWVVRRPEGHVVVGLDIESGEEIWRCPLNQRTLGLSFGPSDGLLLHGEETLRRIDPGRCEVQWEVTPVRRPPSPGRMEVPESLRSMVDGRRQPIAWTPELTVAVVARQRDLVVWDPANTPAPESEPPAALPSKPSGGFMGIAGSGVRMLGGAGRPPTAGFREPLGFEGTDHADWLLDPDGVERRLRQVRSSGSRTVQPRPRSTP